MLVAVLVRGLRNLRYNVKATLRQLKLTRRYHAVLLEDTPTFRGMLVVAKYAVAWGTPNEDVVKKLQAKGSQPYRLHPPRKRFGSIKKAFSEKGMLGYWGENINTLLETML